MDLLICLSARPRRGCGPQGAPLWGGGACGGQLDHLIFHFLYALTWFVGVGLLSYSSVLKNPEKVPLWVWILVLFEILMNWFRKKRWLTQSKSHEFPDSVTGNELQMQMLVLVGPRLITSSCGLVVFFHVVLRVSHFLDVATTTDSSYHGI